MFRLNLHYFAKGFLLSINVSFVPFYYCFKNELENKNYFVENWNRKQSIFRYHFLLLLPLFFVCFFFVIIVLIKNFMNDTWNVFVKNMSISVKTLSKKKYVDILWCCLVWLVYVSQFQENPEHVKKLGDFSVTMENVSTNPIYAILAMSAEIIAMSRWKMVPFVVGELLKSNLQRWQFKTFALSMLFYWKQYLCPLVGVIIAKIG